MHVGSFSTQLSWPPTITITMSAKKQDIIAQEESIQSFDEGVGDVEAITTHASAYHKNAKGEDILHSGLKAGLKNRMVNLIAICGIIGPGSFMGFGNMLYACGPAGMVAGFTIVGIVVMITMFDVGELNAAYDANFAILGSRFISKGFGATLALAYAVLWITNIISEYTSLCVALEVYTGSIPFYGWFLIMWVFFTCFQTLNVSWWGETEYVLGFVKLGVLTAFYLFAIIYAAGGIKDHDPGNPFGNYPLKSGFKGIANAFVYAGVFYSGVEGVSIIAAETRNPRKAIPAACRSTVFRIFYVYFGLSVTYGITVSYVDPAFGSSNKLLRSPMTIAFTNAGWENSKYYVTSMVLITCVSSINSAIYFASRAIFTWAEAGYGPKIFTKTTSRGVPYVAIHFCHLWGFLCLLASNSGSAAAYGYIVSVAGVSAFIAWVGVILTHMRFRRAWNSQGLDVNKLPFKTPWFPWLDYVGIAIGVLLVLVQGWSCFVPFDYKTFVDSYILLPIFFICWFCYDKFYFKSGFVKKHEIDFSYGRRQDLDDKSGESIDDFYDK